MELSLDWGLVGGDGALALNSGRESQEVGTSVEAMANEL